MYFFIMILSVTHMYMLVYILHHCSLTEPIEFTTSWQGILMVLL